jgi:hypothetical protein
MAYNSSQNEAILKFLVNSPFTLFSAMFHPVTSSPMILHDQGCGHTSSVNPYLEKFLFSSSKPKTRKGRSGRE